MRSASNVVLLTIALMAVIVAVFAGLSLVRQRSEGGAPASVDPAVEVAEPVQENLAA